MSDYQIYHVLTYKVLPGKNGALSNWWRERGQALYAAMPGVRSIQSYITQWGLGGPMHLELWLELENYAAYDRIDESYTTDPEKYTAVLSEQSELAEWLGSKVLGTWP